MIHTFKKICSGKASVLLLLILVGCGGKTAPVVQQIAPLPQQAACKIAVLPFVNETDLSDGDIIPYRVFMSELSRSDGYYISQEGDIRNLYLEMRIYPGRLPNFEQLRILSDRLEVDLLISGKIIEMSQDKSTRGKPPALGMTLAIIDGKTGKTLWTTYHRKEGGQYRKVMHFGLINTVTSLAQRMSREIVDSWFDKGLKVCYES